jgi:hypothetical protein
VHVDLVAVKAELALAGNVLGGKSLVDFHSLEITNRQSAAVQ